MGFSSFPANFAGTPPAPFSPFERGDDTFYLVGIVAHEGERPAASVQLVVEKDTVSTACDKPYRNSRGQRRKCGHVPGHPGKCGWSPNPVIDTVTEEAYRFASSTGNRRARKPYATRTYSYSRYEKGALAAALAAAVWMDAQTGQPLVFRVWSHMVLVDEAAEMGYRVPGRRLARARMGNRARGVEDTRTPVEATIREGKVVAAATAEPESAPPAPSNTPTAADQGIEAMGHRFSVIAAGLPKPKRERETMLADEWDDAVQGTGRSFK